MKGEEEPREVIRKVTRRGPLVETLIGGRRKRCNLIGDDVSIAWAGMASTFHSLASLLTLSTQTELENFVSEGLKVREVSLNYLVGSRDGQIAYFPVGGQPIKKYLDGGFYKNGSDSAQEWQGYHQNVTTLVNPKRGWIATANNRMAP